MADCYGLGIYDDFIIWELDGNDKIPLDYRTGKKCNPHKRQNRTDYNTAVEAAAAHHAGVGFVFAKTNPFFFIDIDRAYVDGQLRPECREVVDRFKGAFVEKSQSGTGLHIIGTCDKVAIPANHRCKARNNDDSFDAMFTHSRFVALTEDVLEGHATAERTTQLLAFISERLTPDATSRSIEWTVVPIEGGIESDTEVIQRACDSRSTAGAFGHSITFEQLWTGDIDALATHFPPVRDGGAYDASKADAALAQHLAFWTGGNCEQMERIMRQSALQRDKWDDREDYYLPMTITKAVGRQTTWYGVKEVCNDVSMAVPSPPDDDGLTIAGVGVNDLIEETRYLTAMDQIKLFEGCVYVAEVHRVLLPCGRMYGPETFRARFGGYEFEIGEKGKSTDNAFKAFTESRLVRFPRVDGMFFNPKLPARAVVDGAVNTYIPMDVYSQEGDVSLFLAHVKKLLPDKSDRDIILDYMAACVQMPGDKFQWTPLIQGVEGNGKTVLSIALRNAIGHRYYHQQDPEDLGNVFNAWLERAIVVSVEEVFVNRRHEFSNRMKAMITNECMPIQSKGKDQRTALNCAKFILFSNHKDGVYKHKSDRRYAVFFTAQQEKADKARDGLTGSYFKQLYGWMNSLEGQGALTWYLQHREIKTGMMGEAPSTTSTEEAIDASLGSEERVLMDAIELETPGMRGGMLSSIVVGEVLKQAGYNRVHPRRRSRILANIGYEVGGQIKVDGVRFHVFMHSSCRVEPSEIRQKYVECNQPD